MAEHYDKAMLERAARAEFDVRDGEFDLDEWEDVDSLDRERYVCNARAILDAAAPLIAAKALRDAAADVLDTRGERKWLTDRADEIERGRS